MPDEPTPRPAPAPGDDATVWLAAPPETAFRVPADDDHPELVVPPEGVALSRADANRVRQAAERHQFPLIELSPPVVTRRSGADTSPKD